MHLSGTRQRPKTAYKTAIIASVNSFQGDLFYAVAIEQLWMWINGGIKTRHKTLNAQQIKVLVHAGSNLVRFYTACLLTT